MKKILAMLLCLVLLATCFVACNKEEEPAETTGTPAETTTEAPTQTTKAPAPDDDEEETPPPSAVTDKLDAEGNGAGTEADPYLLKQANFADYYENFSKYADKHVKLAEDIVINEGDNQEWYAGNNLPAAGTFGLWTTSIGGDKYLTGSLDGDGHSISGVCLDGTSGLDDLTNSFKQIALFAGVTGTVKNLKLINSYIASNCNPAIGDYGNTAAIAARLGVKDTQDTATAVIDNCFVDAIVVGQAQHASQTGCGGIVGGTYGAATVSNCVFTGLIDSLDVTGGILGNVTEEGGVTVTNCVNYANIVTSVDRKSTGGIVGHIAGVTSPLTIENCVNAGNITGAGTTGGRQPGGIFGHHGAANVTVTIKNCLNVGNISNTHGTQGAAGIVGNNAGMAFVIEKCMNLGNATATGTKKGDLATTSFTAGKLTLTNYFVVAGYSDAILDGTNATTGYAGTTALTADQLKTAATFATGGALAGWTFVDATKVPTPIEIPTAILWANVTPN